MRQLKTFMKAKKPMWRCGECKCITLQCWRDNDEFCNCGTSSEGLGVEYKFKDWNGRILRQGSVEEGATPTPPADPTREPTAEYTYTFAGWDPEVGPISEDTIYTATYTATVNEYTVTWVDGDGNVLDTDTLEYGTLPRYEGATPTKTATAEYTYTFSGWSPEIALVTGDITYTAQFEATPRNYTVTIGVSPEGAGTVDTQQVTVAYGTEISNVGNELIIGSNTITATAGSGYAFSSWGTLPETVESDLTITATFEATQSIPLSFFPYYPSDIGYAEIDGNYMSINTFGPNGETYEWYNNNGQLSHTNGDNYTGNIPYINYGTVSPGMNFVNGIVDHFGTYTLKFNSNDTVNVDFVNLGYSSISFEYLSDLSLTTTLIDGVYHHSGTLDSTNTLTLNMTAGLWDQYGTFAVKVSINNGEYPLYFYFDIINEEPPME